MHYQTNGNGMEQVLSIIKVSGTLSLCSNKFYCVQSKLTCALPMSHMSSFLKFYMHTPAPSHTEEHTSH